MENMRSGLTITYCSPLLADGGGVADTSQHGAIYGPAHDLANTLTFERTS